MSPEDIDRVADTWRIAHADVARLTAAIGDRLPGVDRARADRARWIVRSVASLAPALDHPTAFVPAASELIAQRYPLTLDELAEERAALLGALDERCGRLDDDATRAWDLALGLFAEIACSLGLDPFGCADDPPRVSTP